MTELVESLLEGVTRRQSLRRGVYLLHESGGARLNAWPHTLALGELGESQLALLRDLASGAVTDDDVDDVDLLHLLERGGWLDTTYEAQGRRLMTVRAHGADPGELPEVVGPVELHRDVVMHRDDDGIVVERPGPWCTILVHDSQVLGMLTGLVSTCTGEDRALIRAASAAGLVTPPVDAEEETLSDVQWKAHERWFHERSRLSSRGHFGDAFGGTFWARGRFDPLPARPSPRGGTRIELQTADIADLRVTDSPLTTVLEDRSSVRNHDSENPLDVGQLGEFLYRTSRVRFTRVVDGLEYSNRPYPAGGSMYELEVYPVVRDVAGLDPAMYHYDSHDHVLERVADIESPAVQRMMRVAAHSTVAWEQPQVLLVISARIGRIMWKYESMAYALVLKHVGVLYQTMYLVGTSMGLASCAIGSGDAHAFSEATGVDSATEPSVGEFLLGSRRTNVPIWEM